MNKKITLIAAALTLLAAACPADELALKGRDIFNKNQHAIITVQVVLKFTGGRAGQSESKQDLTGLVIDPSGLAVLALSSVDPTELWRRVSDDYNKVDTQVDDIQILLDDGTEVSSEIVLRDKDLDLAFIRPKIKPAAPMAWVDLSKSSPAELLEPVIALNRLTRAAGRAYSASVERIGAVIQKPRTFYIPEGSGTSASLGSPVFALDGNIVGVFVMRAVSAGDSSTRNNMRDNMTAILLPAEDILKGAKQAPEARGDTAKPADSKDAKDAVKDTPKDQK